MNMQRDKAIDDAKTIEVLRAGVSIVMSETGGNKYFREIPSEKTIGINFFDIDNPKLLLNVVQDKIKEKNENFESYLYCRQMNRLLFEQWFSLETYTRRYIDTISNL